MHRAKPETLHEDVVSILQAKVSEFELRRLFPMKMDDLDPLSEPEPSIGLLIQLKSGGLVVAIYGRETGTLSLRIPESESVADALKAILDEILIEKESISWLVSEDSRS